MNDRFSKLAKERADLIDKLSKVEGQLSQELKTVSKSVPPVRKAGRPKVKKEDKANPDKPEGKEKEKKRSLKDVVQEVLSSNKDGMEMKEVVESVKSLIEKGEYKSKADNVAAVIAQALFHLQKDSVVQRNKETKRYFLATAAA
jgi:anti-sigma28 factor (negative regulator of flagellin synthesis)